MNDGFRGHSMPQYDRRLRAWVVFDGTAATPVIRSSEAVRSVTKGGTGDYTIELEYPMTTKYWAWTGSCRSAAGSFIFLTSADQDATLTSRRIRTVGITVAPAVAATDSAEVVFLVFGE